MDSACLGMGNSQMAKRCSMAVLIKLDIDTAAGMLKAIESMEKAP